MIESVVVGAIVGGAASYLALRVVRAARKDGPPCGGACGREGETPKDDNRLGKKQELVQVNVDKREA